MSSKTTCAISRAGCSRRIDTLTVVVLAAGRSSRFGSNKLLREIGGQTLLARALRACGSYPAVVVTSAETAVALSGTAATVVINDTSERGMSHSLRLANARVAPEHSIAVLPADLIDVTADDVASLVEQSYDADVTLPARGDGTLGHPVVFSAAARRYIDELPDGDTIRLLRDRAGLSRRVVRIEEPWPYRDVDVESDLPPGL